MVLLLTHVHMFTPQLPIYFLLFLIYINLNIMWLLYIFNFLF